ncbi:MAG: 50S ribosomal protein L17 [Fimbriimonadales bacterium]|nr:MAG: 50S ribosomal protein L17 [Armatimonadota bacterium]MBV6502667.1 50S ribosomal protein L17 [Fimbriimonadales bacterium]MCE7898485.1 50S ribosomal protein L17 [Armatimonadetes bacterium ATM1]MDL1928222.1 50S ribosomal protein L17 [Fimbriimonadia bacterium ATM]MBC6968676.1 50S ribosomal protein L17 [Armatimonadota bacterium]
MRHKVDRRKLGLPSDQRKALLTNLTRQFIRHGYVHTTVTRAKELRRIVEPLITLAKQDSIAARRQARRLLVGHSTSSPAGRKLGLSIEEEIERSLVNGEDLVKHLFDRVAPRFKDRPGGYTRITKTGHRRGDGAPTAVIELVD